MRIGFIGGGNMAVAMIAAVRRAAAEDSRITVGEIDADRRQDLADRYGVEATADNAAVADGSDMLILAVKPQVLPAVAETLRTAISDRHLVVSIAAGIRLAALERLFPAGRLVRVMPNLPCQVGRGMSVFCLGRGSRDADRVVTQAILDSFGASLELPEAAFDTVTAVSGSGPAFTAWFTACLIRAGEAEGLPREAATVLAIETVRGTGELLAARAIAPATLIEQVKSPGGTTAAGMRVLEESPMERIIRDTIRAAADRSKELSQA